VVGAALFLSGIASQLAGVPIPFDPHHVITQAGGVLLLLIGLSRLK
jgi:hypothetical protein